MYKIYAAVVIAFPMTSTAAFGQDAPGGPADPVVRDAGRLDAARPIERELEASVPDGFSVAATGDLIISRPLSQTAGRLPAFGAVLDILRRTDVTVGNLETTIFDGRKFEGSPYSWEGDWTNASVPAVAQDLKSMGFALVGRANNHSQDWGLAGMRETSRWLDDAGIAHAGAGESHRAARAPAYVETAAGRVGLVSIASTFRPGSESLPPSASAPGRPGLSALHVTTVAQVPPAALAPLAEIQCQLYRRHCGEAPREGSLFGMSYRASGRFSYQHDMNPEDLEEIYRSIRSAQQNADFVVVAIHTHECSLGCDDDSAPRGAADFLKRLARGAIDSGADMFVATGNHNLGPMEIYRSPRRGYRPIFYGLGNFFWSDVQEMLPEDLFRGNRDLLSSVWKEPGMATEYDLTAPLNKVYFAHDYTFQSVVAEVRFDDNELSRVILHPVELGYGSKLTESGIPRLVTEDPAAREIIGQIADQNERFGLPELDLHYAGGSATARPPAGKTR